MNPLLPEQNYKEKQWIKLLSSTLQLNYRIHTISNILFLTEDLKLAIFIDMVDADEFNENIARWPSINYVRLFRDNFGFPSAYQKK